MDAAYDPEIYDLFHDVTEVEADVRFYLARAQQEGGPVLDIGAGTGRTLLPIARAGIEAHGLEIDPEMLRSLSRKLAAEPADVRQRVQVFAQDMRTFEIAHRYAAIHIPFRAFLHSIDRDAQLACLRACFAHLRPGGLLAFNVFHPSLTFMGRNHEGLAGVWRWSSERRTADGRRVVLSDANRYDTIKQMVSSRLRYDVYSPEGHLLRTHLVALELAYLYPADIRERLGAAGFEQVQIDGDFEGGALERDGQELVVRARRPR